MDELLEQREVVLAVAENVVSGNVSTATFVSQLTEWMTQARDFSSRHDSLSALSARAEKRQTTHQTLMTTIMEAQRLGLKHIADEQAELDEQDRQLQTYQFAELCAVVERFDERMQALEQRVAAAKAQTDEAHHHRQRLDLENKQLNQRQRDAEKTLATWQQRMQLQQSRQQLLTLAEQLSELRQELRQKIN